MPMTRYEIRNEYSLADPELYRAADKNDPEAILEGVAMAGLVGVLRQLGDLAEFSAEIFHNLHEDIMATAARGHSLMVRVEQLESEVPSIERAFLSLTNHSSFFYNDGIDWHSNLRLDENLVTQGDLPRFIMDSYEECRPPPRLFLLDKFDVAGAGACLKRYTDPSIFKVETSRMTSSDVQRERKILKPKKHLSRRRNGETLEITSARTKLHQLLSEEGAEYGVRNPARRVKLKRKLNGFPFDLKTGKSYMEKLLESPSPGHQLVDEAIENQLPSLVSASGDQNESRYEVAEIQPVGTDKMSVVRKRSPLSENGGQIVLNPSVHETTKIPADEKVIGEKVIAVDAERCREHSSTSYESDNISSEMENFVDAFVTMESDTDAEPMFRTKNGVASTHIISQQLISDANKEHINQRSSDSRSTGDSLISDERKEISSFYSSDSPVTSTENSHLQKPAKGFSSAEIGIDASTLRRGAGNVFSVDRDSQPMVCYSTHSRTDSSNSHASDFDMSTSRLRRNESVSSSVYSDPGVVTKYMLRQPASDETAFNLDDNEKEGNQTIDVPYDHPSTSDSELRHEDEPDHKDGSLGENKSSRLHKLSVRSRRTIGARQSGLSKNLVSGKTDDKVSALHKRLSSGYLDKEHHRNNVPHEENVTYKLDNDDLNLSVGAATPDYFSDLMAPSLGKKLTAHDEPDSSISSGENQISSEKLILSQEAKSEGDAGKPDPSLELDEVILTTRLVGREVNEISNSEENQVSSEKLILSQEANSEEDAGKPHPPLELDEVIVATRLVGQEISEISDSEENQISSEKLILSQEAKSEEDAVKPDPSLELDDVILPTRLVGQEVNEISDCANLKLLNEVCLDFDESGLEGEKSSHVDAVVLYVDNDAEESESHGNFGLPADQLNQVFPHSDEMYPKSSPLFHTNHLQKVDNEDHKGASDSTVTPSIGHPNFQPVSNSSRRSNDDLDVPGLPRESCVNQINPDEDAHVPPLPPMQWRMGSLNSASSSSEVELKKLELSRQLCSSLTSSSDGVSSLQLSLPEDFSSSQLITPIKEVSFLPREQPALVQAMDKATSEKVGGEISFASLESNDNHEMVDLSPTPVSESMLPEEKDAPEIYTEELPHTCNTLVEDAAAAALDKSNPSEVTVQVNPEVQNIEESNSLSEQIRNNDTPETTDLPCVMENSEQQFVTTTLQSEATSPAEDGATHRFHDGKLTEPGTTLADYTTLDKSEVSSKDMLETIDLPQESVTTTQEGEAMSPAEDRFEHESHAGKLPEPGATLIKDTALDKSEVSITGPPHRFSIVDLEKCYSLSCTILQPRNVLEQGTIEIQKVDEIESPLKEISADDAHETIDMVTPERKSICPADEGAINFDKSQVGDASEQKVDGDSLLEQITTKDAVETIDSPPKIESKEQEIVIPKPVGESTVQSKENEAVHDSHTVKQALPRNPLVEDISVLDKSKLKKATERGIPQVPKLDDKNSFLEQIRSKSFNLNRTASSSRPTNPGRPPATNIRVAAMLEKAKTIRLAIAGGSDEDDDDSWSDDS